MGVSSSDLLSLAGGLLVRTICPLAYVSRKIHAVHLSLGGAIHEVSKGHCVLVPARFRERNGPWITGDAPPSLLLDGFP